MVVKNQVYIVDIEDMGSSGEGVGRIDGFTVFVPLTVVGDRVKIKIETLKKRYAVGKIEEIVRPAKIRQEPICPLFGDCGGCQTMHMQYEAQLEMKRKKLEENLKRIGKIDFNVGPTLGMKEPYYYRNKAQFPIGLKNGKAVIGGFRKGSHDIVDIEHCYIQAPLVEEVLATIKSYIDKYKISVYNEKTGKGLLRYVISRYSQARDQLMVVLVANGEELPQEDKLIEKLKEIPQFVSLILNINKAKTNYALGRETRLLYGLETIVEELGDLTFEISARSFFQVNTSQTHLLYDKVMEYADLKGEEVVFDLYCGLGSISLFLAQRAGHVHGVEIVEDAIEDAKQNAIDNKIENTSFYAGRTEDLLPQLYEKGVRADVVVVDPPRKGCDESVLETILAMKPEKIVYVSCNPASLARDLAYLLEDESYKLEKVEGVDLFPQTSHVEAVTLLTRSEVSCKF